MAQPPTPEQLHAVLSQTLSPDITTRQNAEKQLLKAEKIPGYPLQVLRLVASADPANASVRLAAVILFKNIAKKAWPMDSDDGPPEIIISATDRELIKSNLVELMCTVPPQIKSQCSEAISLIADVDFPSKWTNLLPELVQKFNSPDPAIAQGVLLTANSILKRFRYVQKSDDLYRDILYVLQILQQPLLDLFKSISQSLTTLVNDSVQLIPRFESLRLICRIFFSLNWQELPEYFEDHISEWMEGFGTYLQYQNPMLTDIDEETEPSPIDKLQTAVVENLNLYANKDEEPFIPFLPNFTSLVWNLLLKVSTLSKHDALATTSIKFLSSLVAKQMHRDLFKDEGTLRQIISNIVVPNLIIREVDEERFEDDPEEYILRDMEGSETVSRRKCSQELLRAMCRQYEAETTALSLEHIKSMMSEFSANPANKWSAKDTAINLMLGIAVKAESSTQGVSAVNEKVNVMEFFMQHIVPELQETNQLLRPLVKATSIGFVSTFRNQFTKEHLSALMPLLISNLSSDSVVIHSYAASAVEKILSAKSEGSAGVKTPKFTSGDITPFLESLFTGLFTIIENIQRNENEYAMKCVMRSLSIAKDDIIPVTQTVIEKLTSALGRVAKNPRNPQYNHYLFESIAVLIRSVCSKDASFTEAFETLLFPPFQTVLQMDVMEFIPYVFQVFAQLLEYRSCIGVAYTSLFPPLLTPALWERKGNIPALTRLIQAYLNKKDFDAAGHLGGILGVFQKLLASRSSEANAFDLLSSIILYVPKDALGQYLKTLIQILLTRLQQGKTARYTRLVTNFFALFVGKFGAQIFLDQVNSVQPGLGLMLIMQVWLPRLQTDAPVRLEAKTQVVGLTKLLCETRTLLSDINGQKIWCQALTSVMKIITSPDVNFGIKRNEDDDFQVEIGYDAAYSRLFFALKTATDPFPEVTDPSLMFAQSLHNLSSDQPGKIPPLINQGLQEDPKLSVSLLTLVQKAGLTLV